MSNSVLNLYNDIVNNRLVEGLNSRTSIALREFFQGETVSIRIFPVRPIAGAVVAPFYESVSVAAMDYRLSIGPAAGAESLKAYQDTWSVQTSADSAGLSNYLYADLDLNTTELNTAIGSDSTYTSSLFELQFSDNSAPYRVGYQGPFTLRAVVRDVSGAASLPTPATSYPDWNQANSAFVRKQGEAGEAFELVSQDGTKRIRIYCDDTTGSLSVSPVV